MILTTKGKVKKLQHDLEKHRRCIEDTDSQLCDLKDLVFALADTLDLKMTRGPIWIAKETT